MGKLIVVFLGPFAMLLFGVSLGVVGNLIDAMIEWGASVLLAGIKPMHHHITWLFMRCKKDPWLIMPSELFPRRPVDVSPNSEAHVLHGKMFVSLVVLHCTLAIAALFAHSASDYFNGEQWGYGACYYFAFASFSTIGFGDFAMGPTDNSVSQLGILHLQTILIIFGLSAFNAFASIGADWVKAVLLDVTAQLQRLSISSAARVAPRSANGLPVAPSIAPPSPPPSPSTVWLVEPASGSGTNWAGESEEKGQTVCRVPAHAARAGRLALRLLRAVLGAYAVMLVGGSLLYAAEAQHEIQAACAGRAEENRQRLSMRLPPLVDSVCLF